jgi:hypothetical protein
VITMVRYITIELLRFHGITCHTMTLAIYLCLSRRAITHVQAKKMAPANQKKHIGNEEKKVLNMCFVISVSLYVFQLYLLSYTHASLFFEIHSY